MTIFVYFSGHYQNHPLGKISFRALNGEERLIVNSKDPTTVQTFTENLKQIKDLFLPFYPSHTANLLNIFLYNTDLWSEKDLLSLKALPKIRAIEELSRKLLSFQSDYTENCGELIQKLRFQCGRNSTKNLNLIPLDYKYLENITMTGEEHIWLKNLKNLYFQDICKLVKYDSNAIQGIIDLQRGKIEQRQEMMFNIMSVMIERFQRLLEDGLGLNIQGNFKLYKCQSC